MYTSPYYGSLARRDDPLPVLHLGSRGKRRLLSTAIMNSMHLSKPNVYQTLVLVWRFTLRPWLLLAIHDAPSEETSIDTFVQLVSLHFSGLIAIVRSQEARLSGFKNREER